MYNMYMSKTIERLHLQIDMFVFIYTPWSVTAGIHSMVYESLDALPTAAGCGIFIYILYTYTYVYIYMYICVYTSS